MLDEHQLNELNISGLNWLKLWSHLDIHILLNKMAAQLLE